MHYELSRLNGDNIGTFHDRAEALSKAAEVLGVLEVGAESEPYVERPGYVLTRLYASLMQRFANEPDSGLVLHAFDDCEGC